MASVYLTDCIIQTRQAVFSRVIHNLLPSQEHGLQMPNLPDFKLAANTTGFALKLYQQQ